MMDYSKLSDFDINCEVLAAFSPDIKHMCLSVDDSCFYDCGPAGDGWNQIDIPDYCNNPATTWPIILDNKINIEFEGDVVDGKEEWWTIASWGRSAEEHQFCTDDNPLRAAMIVFLMMQESANVQDNPA